MNLTAKPEDTDAAEPSPPLAHHIDKAPKITAPMPRAHAAGHAIEALDALAALVRDLRDLADGDEDLAPSPDAILRTALHVQDHVREMATFVAGEAACSSGELMGWARVVTGLFARRTEGAAP